MSISPRVLGFLLLALPNSSWPENLLEQEIDRLIKDERFPFYRRLWLNLIDVPYSQRESIIQQHLRTLEAIGLIQKSVSDTADDRPRPSLNGWELRNPDQIRERFPDQAPPGGGNQDGGNGGRGGGNNDGGQDGDSGRGGIREVLGHATLFSLPKPEFEDWVDNLF